MDEKQNNLKKAWASRWNDALSLWSKFTKLSEPRWCFTVKDENAEGLSGSFAMIRFDDHAVVISLSQIEKLKLQDYALEIMGHEIGHHVYCPADLSDQGRMIARIRRGLPTKEHLAGFIGNLYADLLINDRLQRSANLNMAGVYKTMGSGSADRMWMFYMRVYEILWSLPKGSLASGKMDEALEGDAQLGARVVRVYAKDWLKGAGRFAALCLPYLMEDEGAAMQKLMSVWQDTKNAGAGGEPSGLSEMDEDEEDGAMHPSLDKEVTGLDSDEDGDEKDGGLGKEGTAVEGGVKSKKKYREPQEYGEILKSLGVKFNAHEIAVKYYRERAMPHLIRFPVREHPQSTEPMPEGLQSWDYGQPLENVDWFESLSSSPYVVPGVTTVQRTYGTTQGSLPEKEPVDLYLGVDCSGSMLNPQMNLSYPVLAGAIMALSALRAGARVMVALSGEPGKTVSTGGFIREEKRVLEMLTGYLGTGAYFGVHRLIPVFENRKKTDRAVHILIITDTDIFTSLENVLEKKKGWEAAKESLEKARGGGTYVMHVYGGLAGEETAQMESDGWHVHQVYDWEQLVAFAREFSRALYEELKSA